MKNKAAQELANLRHLSLTPERRKEISQKAAQKSVEVRRKKAGGDKSLTNM